MVLYREQTFDSDEKILAGVDGMRSPVHVTIDPAKMTADAEGRKYPAPGFWVAGPQSDARVLPRSLATAAAATTDTAIELADVQPFIPGDVVYAVPASAQIDLTGAWAATQTLTVTVAGLDYVYTATAALTPAQMAVEFATAFNDNPATRGLAQAVAGGDSLTITAKDFKTPHAIAVAATGGAATIVGGQAVLLPFRMIGTVDVGGVDVPNKMLRLTAPAAVAIAPGMPVGTADIPVGFHLRALDLNEQCGIAGLYTSLSGKRGAFPYIDDGLEAQFVEIQAVNA